MFKIHFGKEGHNLTQQDFDYLATKTDGFSGSDISGLVKQALMIPVSRIQKAQYFYINPNDQLFYPCQKDDPVRSDIGVFISRVPFRHHSLIFLKVRLLFQHLLQ